MSPSRRLLSFRAVKRLMMTVMGGSVVLIGVALLVLPGPAFLVIPLGLALLATEYAWARHWLKKAKAYAGQLSSKSGWARRAHVDGAALDPLKGNESCVTLRSGTNQKNRSAKG